MDKEKIIQIGHSPDPDDAFMFYGIQSGNVDLAGYDIKHVIDDIETLNNKALKGELEASAISLHCYPYVKDRYAILPCGVSMGDDYGPILVSKSEIKIQELKTKKVAAPGRMTTASLVAKLAIPGINLIQMPFDKILPAVISGEIDAGILIHEGQLTYSNEKLVKLLDLGKWWKKQKGLPLPLGVDVVRRDLPAEKTAAIQRILKESIRYALEHRKEALKYALQFGRGLSHELADRFVGMYVNHYTVNFGDTGRKALQKLLDTAYENGFIKEPCKAMFSDEMALK